MIYLPEHENIRAKLWERKFPGSIAEIATIFGTELPTVAEIATWRSSWNDRPHNQMQLGRESAASLTAAYYPHTSMSAKVEQLAEKLNIHPYFYILWSKEWTSEVTEVSPGRRRTSAMIKFYFPEHLTMFALAWDL
jgi:hypothetical protein